MNKTILALAIIALCLSGSALSGKSMRGGSGDYRPSSNDYSGSRDHNTNDYDNDGDNYSNYPRNRDGRSNYPSRDDADTYPTDTDSTSNKYRDNDYDNDGNNYSNYPHNNDNGSNYPIEDDTETTESDPTESDPTSSGDDSTSTPTDSGSESTSTATAPSSDFATECLNAHNTARQAVGAGNLVWSDELASDAQSWSKNQASLGNGNLKHAGADDGENLASGKGGSYTPTKLIDLWINEKKYFIPGCTYPDCSTGGVVGHYTQMVWGETTQVGCGLSEDGSGWSYLVCRYRAAGNMRGEKVY